MLKTWGDEECPHLKNHKTGLEECKAKCVKTEGCNAINFNSDSTDCVLRKCETTPPPKPKSENAGYKGYFLKKQGMKRTENCASKAIYSYQSWMWPLLADLTIKLCRLPPPYFNDCMDKGCKVYRNDSHIEKHNILKTHKIIDWDTTFRDFLLTESLLI